MAAFEYLRYGKKVNFPVENVINLGDGSYLMLAKAGSLKDDRGIEASGVHVKKDGASYTPVGDGAEIFGYKRFEVDGKIFQTYGTHPKVLYNDKNEKICEFASFAVYDDKYISVHNSMGDFIVDKNGKLTNLKDFGKGLVRMSFALKDGSLGLNSSSGYIAVDKEGKTEKVDGILTSFAGGLAMVIDDFEKSTVEIRNIYGSTQKFEHVKDCNSSEKFIELEFEVNGKTSVQYVDALGRMNKEPTQSGADFVDFTRGTKRLEDLKTEYFRDPIFRKALLNDIKRRAMAEIDFVDIEKLTQIDKPELFRAALNIINNKTVEMKNLVEAKEKIDKSTIPDEIKERLQKWAELALDLHGENKAEA